MNYIALIDYFKKGIVAKNLSENIPFEILNKKSIKYGYIIHPDCCNKMVSRWLDTLTRNYNATFYKTWNDVISKDRFELYIDQILHYTTTYGQNHQIEGNGYVPNEGVDQIPFDDLKVILPITEDELCEKCINVLKSGIALASNTTFLLSDYYLEHEWYDKKYINVKEVQKILSEIKNKEALCYISNKMEILPNDEFGMLRCIIYKYTGKLMLIKDIETINQIKLKSRMLTGFKSPLLNLKESQIYKLSRIFLRYKPLFLAMKGSKNYRNREVCHIVNKIRRAAVKNHTPLKIGFWENIITTQHPIKEVEKELQNIDNFRKIRLMMVCKQHLECEKSKVGLFTIRNGKQFIRENYNPKYNMQWIRKLYYTIEKSVCNFLRQKACTVRLPTNYDISLPTSEKNYIGNFPYGTSFAMTKDNIIGIYWRNEWGTCDFDLSMCDIRGNRIAWNAEYYRGDKNKKVIYSGDMTNADPEASELLYINKDSPDGVILVNKFRNMYGMEKSSSELRFFYANSHLNKVKLNYMVNPNDVKFDTMITFDGSERQKTIGFIFDNRFYLSNMTTGKKLVSNDVEKHIDSIMKAIKDKAKGFISLREILQKSGFTILNEEYEVDPDIDFNNLEKDTLINLFTEIE